MTPSGWGRATLREVVLHLGRGTSPSYVAAPSPLRAVNQKCVRNGRVGVEHVRPHDASAPVRPESVLRPGDVCVNSTGTGTIGRVGLWEPPSEGTYFVDTHVTLVRPNPAYLVPKFLSATLLAPAVQREMEVTCFTGSTNQIELSKTAFGDLRLLLPPLGEQRKIAAILSSVDDAIEATQAVIDQLQVVKKAMMAELLTRGLPGRHTRFKMTEIGEVPEEWEVVPLLAVVRLPSGQVDPRIAPYSSMPLVAPNHIESHSGRLLALETAAAQRAISGKYEFAKGDVIYSKIRPYLRKAWIADRPGICSADMYPMRSDRVLPEFLFMTLMSERFSEFTASLSMRTGIPKINREELSQFRVALPAPAEQSAVAGIHKASADLEHAEHEKLSALVNVKTALMSVLLTGEVRVEPGEDVA